MFKAREWFSGKCALLLIDNAWGENESGRDVVARLSPVMDRREGSRVVFTTRDVRIGLGSESFHFSARSGDVSRKILLASAGSREEDIKDVHKEITGCIGRMLGTSDGSGGCAVRLGFGLGGCHVLT